jgi:hypothetical protein
MRRGQEICEADPRVFVKQGEISHNYKLWSFDICFAARSCFSILRCLLFCTILTPSKIMAAV